MVKKLINLIAKDLAIISRDKIMLYVIFVPVVVSILLSLILPGIHDINLTIAVDQSVERHISEKITPYVNIHTHKSLDLVYKSVREYDHIAGLTKTKDGYKLIFEGNESSDIKEYYESIIYKVISKNSDSSVNRVSLGSEITGIREYILTIFFVSMMFISGMLIAFLIIEDKETKAFDSMFISPVRIYQYIASKEILGLSVSIILSALCGIILFKDIRITSNIVIGTVFSSGLGILLGFLIGIIADNQITGLSMIKVVILIFIGIPIGAIFIPLEYQFTLYPLPNYWIFKVYENIFFECNVRDFWVACFLTLLSSNIVTLFLIPVFKKRLKFR